MSHVVKMEVEIRDLDALRAACERLGFRWNEGVTTYRWYGRWVGDTPMPEGITREQLGHCQHEIVVPGCQYSVGVVAVGGHYSLLWDFYDSRLKMAMGGERGDRLVQAYGVEAASALMRASGAYLTEETVMPDGTVRLVFEESSL